ncbi:hypothetical protein FRC08_015900 [Ceratobasidium sp. 394]|nr:hypothetical protein FRC08_015900 [Ceratobasidium sp. 394]
MLAYREDVGVAVKLNSRLKEMELWRKLAGKDDLSDRNHDGAVAAARVKIGSSGVHTSEGRRGCVKRSKHFKIRQLAGVAVGKVAGQREKRAHAPGTVT